MAKTTVIVECEKEGSSITIENNLKICKDLRNPLEFTKIGYFPISEGRSRLIATIMAYNSKYLLAKTDVELRDEMLKIMEG